MELEDGQVSVEKSQRMGKRPRGPVILAGSLVLSTGLGFFAAFKLYDLGWLSWSGLTEFAVPSLLAFTLLVATVALVAVFLPERFTQKIVAVLAGFALGATAGIAGPGFLGEQAVWDAPVESVVYKLDTQEIPIPADLISDINNPLMGERSTLHYLSPLSAGGVVMVSSAGTEIFDFIEAEPELAEPLRAVLSLWSPDLDISSTVDITEVEPQIQLVRGVLVDEQQGVLYLTNLPTSTGCFGLQLWKFGFNPTTGQLSNSEQIFQSSPCLEEVSGAERFGGRIEKDSSGNLYLSVGDFGNGISTVREEQTEGQFSARPEIMKSPHSIGAIVRVEPGGSSQVISRGHRNPQGLEFDPVTNRLWESEHGPKGGDEINLIEEGNDYGWPDVTYGGPYGGEPQPSGNWNPGRWYGASHGEFTEPLVSWLPAIAVSQLIVYQGNHFPAWKGDLLVSAFRGDIHRVRLAGDRIVFDETIHFGVRPRDLVELHDGTLLMSTDSSTLILVSQP